MQEIMELNDFPITRMSMHDFGATFLHRHEMIFNLNRLSSSHLNLWRSARPSAAPRRWSAGPIFI